MPIRFQQPPATTIEILRESAETMPRPFAEHARMIRAVADAPERHCPHPVYIAGLRDLAAADGLRQAEVAGWRYLAQSGDPCAIEVDDTPEWDGQQLTEIDKGPFVDGLCRLLADQELARQTEADDLNLSVLRINALGIFAVWLRADDSQKDRIIPLQPAPDYLQPGQTYSVQEFQDALLPQAKRNLKSGRTSDA
jgi:integrase